MFPFIHASISLNTKTLTIASNRNFKIIKNYPIELISEIRVFLKLSVDSLSCLSAARLYLTDVCPFCRGFFLCFWQLCPSLCRPPQRITERSK